MKILTKLIMIFVLASTVSFAKTGTLTVEIDKIENSKGLIRVILFDKTGKFPKDHKSGIAIKSIKAKKGKVIAKFDSIKYGEYAISVLHDENKNEKMDSNFLGMPKEGFGISNNVRVKFRHPKFDEAKFIFNEKKNAVNINLIYL
jgi:uncharacterized protein (DUF2141 family)